MAEFMDEFFDEYVTTSVDLVDHESVGYFSYEKEDGHFSSFDRIMELFDHELYTEAQDEIADEIARLLILARQLEGVEVEGFYEDKLHALRESGQEEYARKNINAFANFERAAGIMDLERERVLMVYLLKHIDGISSWINGNRDQRETILDRIGDACVYLFLLAGMAEDRKREGWGAKNSGRNGLGSHSD